MATEIHTGVTAVLPHGGNLFQEKVAGAVFVGNAFGKLAGSTQVQELGTIETPIVLTNTLAVGTALEAVVAHTLAQPGNELVRSVNPLVGETNDAGLNDIRRHADQPRPRLVGDRECEGRPGGGGERRRGDRDSVLRLEGGHRDRLVARSCPSAMGGYTLGVLVQANFGGVLTIAGAPVGKELGRYAFAPPEEKAGGSDGGAGAADGSCMIVVATDAPLDARDLHRLAARAVFGMGRTGASYANGSGDFAIAFSTSPEPARGMARSSPDRGRFYPRMPCHRCSRQRSRPRRRQSTTPCSRRLRSATAARRLRRSRSTACGRS